MSVLVKGMEMPKDRPQLLWVYPNGKALTVQSEVDPWKELQAVPVPPHGDLIDMDSEIDVYDRYDDDIIRPSTVRDLINDFISGKYPRTIIKAEE